MKENQIPHENALYFNKEERVTIQKYLFLNILTRDDNCKAMTQ